MKTKLAACLFFLAFLSGHASARTWTDVTGRKIEAEILGVEGGKVILGFKGKKIPLDIAKLSDADREFITTWEKEKAGTPSEPSTGGPDLEKGGAVNNIETDLSVETVKLFSKSKHPSTKLKIAIALPADFDPAKHQRVMWVSAAINDDAERAGGNIRSMGMYAGPATQAGWVVVAADGDMGNPRGDDNKDNDDGQDLALHREAIATLAGYWPGFTTWDFAFCGSSGGAKATFYRMGDLFDSELNVVGLFLAGCNEDKTDGARSETRFKRGDTRKVRVYISNGKADTISTVAHAEALEKSIKGGSYGDVRLELFEGGHEMNREEFTKALEWFAESQG